MSKQVLEGVKVLSFEGAIVGPWTTKHLVDHGAQVIRIETGTRGNPQENTRQALLGTWINVLSTDKYRILLNLKNPESRMVVDKAIRWADVITENFTPGSMSKLGLDYESVRRVKPDIIYVSTCIFGQTGPNAPLGGTDGFAQAASGRTFLSGWPDRGGLTPASYPYGDGTPPIFNAMAIVAALDYRRRTGRGQYIDVSMTEICANQITEAFLDWKANARLQTRIGNRNSYASPHGVFPCQGDDRWCAIAVFSEGEWDAFCKVIGNPLWTRESRFSSLKLRKDNEDELEKLTADWTRGHSAEEVMFSMQAAGVAAGVVQNARDLQEHDPQLKAREWLVSLEHPVLGVFGHPTPPYKLSKTKAEVKRTFSSIGEDTEYVCTSILGIAREEFDRLSKQGIFT